MCFQFQWYFVHSKLVGVIDWALQLMGGVIREVRNVIGSQGFFWEGGAGVFSATMLLCSLRIVAGKLLCSCSMLLLQIKIVGDEENGLFRVSHPLP